MKVDSSNQSGLLNYFKFSGPVYYHVTNRKVTEHFVDTQGKPIPPPRGLDKESKHLLSVTLTPLNRKIFCQVAMKLTQKRINFKDGIKENET